MKRMTVFLLAALCALCCGMTAGAATDQFANAYDLYAYWQEQWYSVPENYETASPYPDYVCGVWSSDGSMESLTFAVTKDEAGEAGKAEILDLVADDSTVSFTYQAYPHYELWAIQQELTPSLGDATGAYGIGVHEMENVVCISINTDNPNADVFMKECFEKYGDRIRFESGSGVTLTAEEVGVIQPGMGTDMGGKGWWGWVLPVLLVCCCAAVFLLREKLPVLKLAGSSREISAVPRTRKETENDLQASQTGPRPEVWDSILEQLDTESK